MTHLSRFILILLLALSAVSVGASYGGDGFVIVGSSPTVNPDSECWDDKDNDGDGLVDELDTGCINPPQSDNSELDRRDFDASWVFASGKPKQFTPSLFIGSPVFISQNIQYNSDWGIESFPSGSSIYETYIANSTETWAGGNPTIREVELPEGYSIVESSNEFMGQEIVKTQSSYSVNYPECGDAIRNTGETNLNCPSDMGLPDDLPGTTVDQSETTITDELEIIDITDYVDPNNDPDDVTTEWVDYNNYDVNLDAKEYRGTVDVEMVDEPSGSSAKYGEFSLQEDINAINQRLCCDDTTLTTDTYEIALEDDNSWKNNPDYYLSSDPSPEIKAVYVDKTKLTGLDGSPKEVFVLSDKQQKYYYGPPGYSYWQGTTCTSTGGAYCAIDQSQTGCEDKASIVVDKWYGFESTDTKTETFSFDSQHLKTSYSNPSYSDDTTTSKTTIDLRYYFRKPSLVVEQYVCDGFEPTAYRHECKYPPKGKGECNIRLNGKKVVPYTTQDQRFWDYKTQNVKLSYEDLKLSETAVYSTYYNQKPSGASYDPVNTLFAQDYFERLWSNPEDIVYKGEYYSVDSGGDPSKNSNSVSRSRFETTIRNGDFYSTREEYASFDVDGDGYGKNFFSIGDKRGRGVIGYNPGFGSEEVTTGDYSGHNFSFPSDFSKTASCPEDYYYCVGTSLNGLKSIDHWGSTAPSTGVEYSNIEDIKHVNNSYGICRMFQYMRNYSGAEPTPLRCQYDNARNFPGNPTPTFKKLEKPFIASLRNN